MPLTARAQIRPDPALFDLAERIYLVRRGRQFTVDAVAYVVGVPVETVEAWENASSRPSRVDLQKLSDCLGVKERLLAKGGRGWQPALRNLGPVPDPDVLAPPTQYPEGLSDENRQALPIVFREKPAVAAPTPAPAKVLPVAKTWADYEPDVPACRFCGNRGFMGMTMCGPCWRERGL